MTRTAPPLDFDQAFAALSTRSALYADLPANGDIVGPIAGALRLEGEDPRLNVFELSAARLGAQNGVAFRVPFGSTTIVNVTGTTVAPPIGYMEIFNGSGFELVGEGVSNAGVDAVRRALLWNFPHATTARIGPGVSWQGSVLAPHAELALPGGNLHGQAIAASITAGALGHFHVPFAGCLPPDPVPDLELSGLCVDTVTNRAQLRLRNTGEHDRRVAWEDRHSAQSGSLTAPAGQDTFFELLKGDREHEVVARAGSTRLTEPSVTRPCRGTIRIGKVATGPGEVPPGPWTIDVRGDSGFTTEVQLASGEEQSVAVPGGFQHGSAPIGGFVGGYRYTVAETDSLGATATVDKLPVTILGEGVEEVTVGNQYPTATPVPTPTPPVPTPPAPVEPPDQPTLPYGAPAPPPGPDLDPAPGATPSSAPDLAISQRLSPPDPLVGSVVAVTLNVRNRGASAADGVVVRELPQHHRQHPNRVARIRSASTSRGRCTHSQPVRCELGTMRPGARAVIRVRLSTRASGRLKSVAIVSAPTPETNTTNNVAAGGVTVRAPHARLRARVTAPGIARAAVPVDYRVTARARDARFVRLCHRPPPSMRIVSARGTFRSGGRLCRDFKRLRAGHAAGFTVRAIPAPRASGRTLRLAARASAPEARTASATAAVRVGTDPCAVTAGRAGRRC